jgi:fibronectin type 3 domain-containing protein
MLFAWPRPSLGQQAMLVPSPTNLSAGAVDNSRIDLSWRAASSGNIATYRVYYDDDRFIASVSGSTTSYSDTGLEPWTVYRYYVTAVQQNGNESGPSNVASARTLDGTPPSAPRDLQGQPISDSEVSLVWNGASDPESGVAGYVIFRDGREIDRTSSPGFGDSGLEADRQYSYEVTAVNGEGLEGAAAGPVQVRTLSDEAPEPPTEVRATAVESNAVELEWNAPPGDEDIDGYRVYRDGESVGTTSQRRHRDSGLQPFTTYLYHVTSIGEDGDESAPSSPLEVMTLDGSAPTKPEGLIARAVGSERIDLAWNAAQDPESGIAFYRIMRNGDEVGTTEGTTYQDFGLESGTTYEYRVSAVNGSGLEGAASEPAGATTLDGSGPTKPTDLTATAIGTDRIELSWSPSTDPETGVALYRVFRDGAEVAAATSAAYTDSGLAPNTEYEYRVSAVNGEGLESDLSEPASAVTLDEGGPPAPADLLAQAVGPDQVNLTWTAPDATDTEIVSYNVYRDGSFVGNVVATVFADAGLSPGTTYRYAVASVNDEGEEGERSGEALATTFPADDLIPPAPPTRLRVVGP